MARAKKVKNEDQKGGDNNNSEAVVKHQKLCLSIDMDKRRIYGYTELQIVIPDNGIVGLHADNLVIEKVTVDGDPAEFGVFPHYQHLDPKGRWCVVSSATSAADASGSAYLSSLKIELLPNLLIMCSKTTKTDNKQEHLLMDDGGPLSADASRAVQVIKHVRIEYWVEKTETGIHFNDNVLHTDSQLRRARCWFPCLDDNSQCCCYDLEFTVASNLVAVSSGTLLHQVLTNDDPPRKTYVYKLDVPVAAQWISLVVAQFEIFPDRHGSLISHFCLPPNSSKLRNTMVFFYNAFRHYEDYLSASFPFGSYTQVFIAPEMTLSSWSLGAAISIFSSHLLFDEKIIDQTIETRIRLAYALARQWFGVYITPEAPNDEWLLDGLARFLTDSFIKSFLGINEARYRRYKANCAVCQADDIGATALGSDLASKALYGTQCIGFYGKIRSWKSVAVLQMLEKQMGPESFRKYNDNSGNTYSDVFWVAALVQSVGELEFGQQSIIYLPSLLKRLDRLLQFDRLMPSHNGILTISCIQSLTQMALKLSEFIPLDRVIELIKPYQMSKTWKIRVAASRALLELEFQRKGTDAALTLFVRYLNKETSLRGQTKLGVCALRLIQLTHRPDCDSNVKTDTLFTLLRLLESPLAFNNVTLRHYIFCILQVLAGRPPTLYGVPIDETLRTEHTEKCSELKNIFANLITQLKIPAEPSCPPDLSHNLLTPENMNTYLGNHDLTNAETTQAPGPSLIPATQQPADSTDNAPEQTNSPSYPTEGTQIMMPNLSMPAESRPPTEQVTNTLGVTNIGTEVSMRADTLLTSPQETEQPVSDHVHDDLVIKKATDNEPDTVSNSGAIKRPKLKIRVKKSIETCRAEDTGNARIMNAQASSSVSIDAQRNFGETISTGNQNFEDVNSCQDVGSRVTASIGSAKLTAGTEELVKELQCTADSSKISLSDDRLPDGTMKIDAGPQTSEVYNAGGSLKPSDGKEKGKKKDKEKKRKKSGQSDDLERLEKKRQKKEKKRKEKELAKILADKQNSGPSIALPGGEKRVASVDQVGKTTVFELDSSTKELYKTNVENGSGEANVVVNKNDGGVNAPSDVVVNRNGDGNANPPSAPSHKIKIKFKNRTLGK